MSMMLVNWQGQVSQEDIQARELACILFKNTLFENAFQGGEATTGQSCWFQIPEENRNYIKLALKDNLKKIDPTMGDQKYMKDICLCISSIAVIEIPVGQGEEIVKQMCQDDPNETPFSKKAGIYSLGLIQETLMPSDFKDADDLGRIWYYMLSNITPDDLEVTRIVAKSIARLSHASKDNFEVEAQQKMIMQGIFDLL